MSVHDLMPILLIPLLTTVLSVGVATAAVLGRRRRSHANQAACKSKWSPPGSFLESIRRRPCSWLVIRSRDSAAVQAALGLHHPKPCSWLNGLAGEEKLFIAPPVKGWILVVGSGLPDPGDDIDVCFRFLVELSCKLGHVQFFTASRVLQHHAWVRVERGRVLRAYAWAGRTLWTQGATTDAEKQLGFKCFDYAELAEPAFCHSEAMSSNVDKVPLLAARWSLDPARIDERFCEQAHGIAGEPSRRY